MLHENIREIISHSQVVLEMLQINVQERCCEIFKKEAANYDSMFPEKTHFYEKWLLNRTGE